MSPRLKFVVSSFLVGLLSIGIAWAGAIVAPGGGTKAPAAPSTQQDSIVADLAALEGDAQAEGNTLMPAPGTVLAGAAKISLEPRPDEFGGVWERSEEACSTFSTDSPPSTDHLASTGSPWPENPNCIYMGGFGIGPTNPITEWDTLDHPEGCESGEFRGCGVWVRTFAVKGSNGKTFTMSIIDAEGYLWDYKSKCDDCGIKQITADLAAEPELGLEKEGIVIGSTHTHSGPEFLGGWGFVPDWYMQQVVESIKDSIRQAVANMEPAILEVGEELARRFNNERRDTYHSAEEQQLTWLRAVGMHPPGNPKTIATIGTYAGHPTSFGTNDGRASADWVGPFEHALEERFGGVGVYFMTGLGNMSNSGGRGVGRQLVNLIPEVGDGLRIDNTELRYAQNTWIHPATNVPLNALGLPGFFDREFVQQPASINTGKSPDTAPCTSASAVGVEMPANAMRIGNQFALTTSPGEIFSNVSNVIKEKSGAPVTMPIAQTQDALGYMPQQIEINEVGQQGLGFVAGGFLIVNYEDSYAIDRCIGDAALEEALGLVRSI